MTKRLEEVFVSISLQSAQLKYTSLFIKLLINKFVPAVLLYVAKNTDWCM